MIKKKKKKVSNASAGAATIDPKKLKQLLAKIDKVSPVQVVPISQLHLDPRNARVHNERNIESIKESIMAFGQQKPVIIDKENKILAGNGFYIAAKAVGLKRIQVVVSALSANMAQAYAITDNRTGELSSFDNQILAGLITDLSKDEQMMDLLEGTIPGFTRGETDNIMSLLNTEGKLEFQGGETEDVELADDTDDDDNSGHTRMVQLFMDGPQFDAYTKNVEFLANVYGTDASSDTVLECLRRAVKRAKANPKEVVLKKKKKSNA